MNDANAIKIESPELNKEVKITPFESCFIKQEVFDEKNTSIETNDGKEIKFEIPDNLKEFQNPIDPITIHKCETCGKGFNQVVDLKKHISFVHKVVIIYKCKICGEPFSELTKLRIHVVSVHETCLIKQEVFNEINTPIETIDTKAIFEIPDNLKEFQNPINIHKCETCNKGFNQAVDLKRHISLSHKAGMMFKCKICGKPFCEFKKLRIHLISVHEINDNYQCDICGKSFKKSNILRSHIKYVHERIKDHKCDKCGKVFGQSCTLTEHINNVHRGNHECELCGKIFTLNIDLETHTMIYHKKIMTLYE